MIEVLNESELQALLAKARAEAFEEAARIAESHVEGHTFECDFDSGWICAARRIAMEIGNAKKGGVA